MNDAFTARKASIPSNPKWDVERRRGYCSRSACELSISSSIQPSDPAVFSSFREWILIYNVHTKAPSAILLSRSTPLCPTFSHVLTRIVMQRLSINVHTRARRPRAYGRSSLLEQNWTQFSDRAVRASSVRVWRCSVRR